MTDMFLEKFRALVPKYLEDEWQEEDGLPAEELDAALAEHQFQVPLVLREFYLAVGGCEDIMEAYHYFWDPEELEVDDEGFLMFLEDEEEQFTWGFRVGDLVIDPVKHEVLIDNRGIQLTMTEFKLLQFLVVNRSRAYTRNKLLNAVLSHDAMVVDRNVNMHVATLRKKLNAYGNEILTIRKLSYKFHESHVQTS